MEHDEICRQQDRELTGMKEQGAHIERDLTMVIERLQRLVDQYHEQNVTIGRMDVRLASACNDIVEIKAILANKVPTREEFLTVRNQLWAGVSVIVMAILSALATWVIKGGLR